MLTPETFEIKKDDFSLLQITLKDGNILVLTRTVGEFYGFKKGELYTLSFGELQSGGYGEDTPSPDKHHFVSMGLEYYSVNDPVYAMNAFLDRVNSGTPQKSSVNYPGQQLGAILDPDVPDPSFMDRHFPTKETQS